MSRVLAYGLFIISTNPHISQNVNPHQKKVILDKHEVERLRYSNKKVSYSHGDGDFGATICYYYLHYLSL